MTGRVYIVDDDPALRDSLSSVLSNRGYDVREFADGRSFLDALDGNHGGCALLDVRLPDMSGLDVLTAAVERAPRLAVVVITGHGEVSLAVSAMKAGAVDFVEKPVRGDALSQVIDTALDTRDAPDPRLIEHLESLTGRERQVLDLLVAGHSNKEVARTLDISPRTAEVHRARVMEKMAADSLSHLVRLALAAGVEPPDL